MESTYKQNLRNLSITMQWRHLVDLEDQPGDEENKRLLEIFNGYADEMRHRLGLTQPYSDDLVRLCAAKNVVRSMDLIFDGIAQRSDSFDTLPAAVQALSGFLRDVSIDLGWVILCLEEMHPELSNFFEVDRKFYAESKEAEQ